MHLTSSHINTFQRAPDCTLAYRVDDFSPAWDVKLPVLMLHGLSESGVAFNQWVPHFADRHAVIRPDLRGYGLSNAMPSDHAYSLDELAADVIALLDAQGVSRCYLIGGKIGGTLALHLAATYPERFEAVAAVAAPASLTGFAERAPTWRAQIREQGVNAWVRETTQWRLGTSLPPEAVNWWVNMMSRTSPSTLDAFLQMVPTIDIHAELPTIQCPTVVITTTGSGLSDVATVTAWQQTIPNSTLEVITGDTYHVAATHPLECARIVRRFFDQIGK